MKKEKTLLLIYLIIWCLTVATFWFFVTNSYVILFTIVAFKILLPTTTFILSVFIGTNNCFGKYKWCVTIILGAMYALCRYVTFGNLSTSTFKPILLIAIISILGLLLGVMMAYTKTIKCR